jgi:hypothetical protein
MNTKQTFIGQPFARLGNFTALLCAVALGMLSAPGARASDPIGIYGFVDRVVFEPNDTAPERVKVWGGFALAKKSENNSEYNKAERGFLYFKLRPGEEEVCKKEWADLKSVAGTKQIVSFGTRYSDPQPTLRKSDAKAENPDVYPKSWGMSKVRMRDYAPLKQLEKLMEKPAKDSPKAKAAPSAKPSALALAALRSGKN